MSLELYNMTLRNDAGKQRTLTRRKGTKLKCYTQAAQQQDPTGKQDCWFKNIEDVRLNDIVADNGEWWFAVECSAFIKQNWRVIFPA